MRASKFGWFIVCVSSVLLTAGAVASSLSLDEIVTGMHILQSDAKEYSGLVDMAFKELRAADSDKLQELTETINERTADILKRSRAIAQQIDTYQSSALREEDGQKIEEISRLRQETEKIFNPAFQQVGNLTKLVFKRNIQDILKVVARELEKNYKNTNSYPERLDQFAELLSNQPYQLSYQKIDAEHFKIEMRPVTEALAQGVVLEQKFVLTEDHTIRIFDLSNKLIGTVDIKREQK